MTHWIEQYWQYALFAAVAVVRASTARTGVSVEAFTADLAARHGLNIS